MSGLAFTPLLPWPVFFAFAVAAVALSAVAVLRRARGAGLRMAGLALVLLALLDPHWSTQVREPRPDIALVVVDDSASQALGQRPAQTAAGKEALRTMLGKYDDVEVRELGIKGGEGQGTRLFAALERALAQVPEGRFAGAVLITDGQVHDSPTRAMPGPVHVLLTGKPGERDRRVVVDKAPAYGIVGRKVTLTFHVEDQGGGTKRSAPVAVHVRRDGELLETRSIRPGRATNLILPIERAGPSVLELEAEAADGELSTANNRTAFVLTGVRDRLRVLLVSGQPHQGERTWRNLLKSDPLVDLVHFTILRPPNKQDFTPTSELSLIAFPVRELFEEKLKDFDLVVLDRYVMRGVLNPEFQRNLITYVQKGGALLAAAGPEMAGRGGLSQTLLREILPARPTGRIVEGGFRPGLALLGKRHPVTALPGAEEWGRWFRYVETEALDGEVLLESPDEAPLLVLHRVDDGRVAQMLSDQVWLWARGFEGGGPYAELVRRLAHWLMKEPDLEEEALRADIIDGMLTITRRTLSKDVGPVTVTDPSGEVRDVTLKPTEPGRAEATLPVSEAGLYRIGDATQTTFAAAGALNPLEDADLRATDARLAALARDSSGGVFWIADGLPTVRRVDPGRDTAGRGWMGLVRNASHVVTGVTRTSLVPGILLLGLGTLLLAAAWWREGR